MKSSTLLAVLLIAAVAALALWLRRQGEGAAAASPTAAPPDDDLEPEDDAEDDFEAEPGEVAAITVDGFAFIGDPHGVSIVPTPDPLAPAPGAIVPAEYLRPGDFSGARVVRGAPSVDPWRLELLGRDGEYVTYGFTGEEAAYLALDLLEKRAVMQYERDEDGNPIPPSSEQFAEARRRHDETERLLALGDGENPEPLQ
ncbi:MAG TPA: hypothetical protein VGK89_11270 [Candidatus Eisenbacteria bacterium]|jgi:hypothetical protein